MKRLTKLAIGFHVLAAAGLTVWSASAKREHAAPAEPSSLETSSLSENLNQAGVDSSRAVGKATPPPAVEAPLVPLPADLKVSVRTAATARVVTLSQQGHLLALLSGKERRIDMHKVAWTLKADSSAPLVFESTDAKTLETIRGEVSLTVDSASLQRAVAPAVMKSSAAFSHECKAHDDGAGGFVVLCQVDGPSAAASVESPDPREGVWSLAGDKTLFRFDMPMAQDGATARAVGYEKAGRGVLLRVEASRAPGETAALLSIGADSRVQPERPRPRCCSCRFPDRELAF